MAGRLPLDLERSIVNTSSLMAVTKLNESQVASSFYAFAYFGA